MSSRILILAMALVAGGLLSCSEESPPATGNLPPTVRLDASPVENGDVSYRVHFAWEGSDPDGSVEHYLYAMSPPEQFTNAEILGGGPGITETWLPHEGPKGVVRVSKTVGDETYTFDWVLTRDLSGDFFFPTPDPVDFEHAEGQQRFFLRSVDDMDARSTPDWVAFTSHTIIPYTADLYAGFSCGDPPTFRLQWHGVDPDGPPSFPQPASYLVKIVPWPKLENPNDVMYDLTPDVPWIEVEGDRYDTTLAPGTYFASVRAVDVAEAEETWLGLSGLLGERWNTVFFEAEAGQTGGRPELTVSEPTIGVRTFHGPGTPEVTDAVATGQKLWFTWSATAASYGSLIDGYNWGLDIPDLEKDGPGSGWRGWSTFTGTVDPVVFPEPGLHYLYVKCRDLCGATTIAAFRLTVVGFPLDRELLLVDDFKDYTFPRDNQHDQFWTDLVANSNRFTEADQEPDRLTFSSHGKDDVFFLDPQSPDLSLIGRYRMILYNTHGAGYNGHCGLNDAGPNTLHLGTYLGAGGKLWICGQYTAGAMVPNAVGSSSLLYPLEIPTDGFAYEFMKIRANEVQNDKNADNRVNGMIGVRPFPNKPEALPAMDIDPLKQSPALRGEYGVGLCDAIFDPMYAGSNPDFSGQIDSLYVLKTIGPTRTPVVDSPFEGKLCGIRWHDPDPARAQGRTMWFGFPMYYFENNQAQETFNRAVDWFREETATP